LGIGPHSSYYSIIGADDLPVIAETEQDLIKRLNEWKDNVENRGMRVNMNKTNNTHNNNPFKAVCPGLPGEPVPEEMLTHPPS